MGREGTSLHVSTGAKLGAIQADLLKKGGREFNSLSPGAKYPSYTTGGKCPIFYLFI